jgi:hypothetical protein
MAFTRWEKICGPQRHRSRFIVGAGYVNGHHRTGTRPCLVCPNYYTFEDVKTPRHSNSVANGRGLLR